GLSRATPGFFSVYPPSHGKDPQTLCLMILVNTCLPASSWKVIPIPSPNIMVIDFSGEAFSTIWVINIYNDCDDNTSLDALH
ncbi:hypothetical protein DFH08DRAFT_643396, partial [Mycena albidolilacea]